ncbi:MAG: hypothetical protein Q4P78_09005, partial [Rothia sp. (in: high G+C Gram-positive bacteria)]|uniref:hypothetical protein n=1 Tax=Rothia sp. (in: high G+C Gram-positive bacteria) TaxID=1885016 RepID=UPI0026DF0CBF
TPAAAEPAEAAKPKAGTEDKVPAAPKETEVEPGPLFRGSSPATAPSSLPAGAQPTAAREQEWYTQLCGEETFIENAAMRHKIPKETVRTAIHDLHLENAASNKKHLNYDDYRTHAMNYLRYWVKNNPIPNNNSPNNAVYSQQHARPGGVQAFTAQSQDYQGAF